MNGQHWQTVQQWEYLFYQLEEANMILSESGTTYEQAPPGTHIARCVKLLDLGTQQSDYQGVVSHKRQVLISWELPNELLSEGEYAGQPFVVSRFYTASLNEKANLRADLASWRGREFTKEELAGFEAKSILDKTCMLSLILNDKGRAKVSGVMALPKGTTVPPAFNPIIYFSLEPDEFNQAVFDSLSEGIRKIIALSPEWKRLKDRPAEVEDDTRENAFDDLEETIPF